MTVISYYRDRSKDVERFRIKNFNGASPLLLIKIEKIEG